MPALRETIKRVLPPSVREAVVDAKHRFSKPPIEDSMLHDYELVADPGVRPRLTMVLPTISPKQAFGGIITGLDIFMDLIKRTGAEARIVLDDFGRTVDVSVVERCARRAGLEPASIEVVPRTSHVPRITMRASDVLFTFNWWTTLNARGLLRDQESTFGVRRPHLYALQDYDPCFYPFSSTHMLARLAYEPRWPCWGIFNSHELHDYFHAQGHSVERAFIFEPKLSDSLRPFLEGAAPDKLRRILVYGRPAIPRNCYPAVEKGLRLWAERYPEFADWEVVSAGLSHPPMPLGRGRAVQSLGKLSLEDYGALLRTTAVGLSLMASPHPSYPPLEMAHFGIRTITNTFANKDLASSHANILSVGDIAPETIAAALAEACRAFETDPGAAWTAPSGRPSFLEQGPFGFLDGLAQDLRRDLWGQAVS